MWPSSNFEASSKAEACFYRKYHVSRGVSLAYIIIKLMRGCNVEIFQPFSKLAAEKQCLHKVGVDVGLIELNKFKKEDKESVAPSKKCEVPYLSMTNIPESVLSILVEGDHSQTHHRHPWMSHDTWDLLWAGDKGASSMKFGFFNTRQLKFLSGTKLNICSMFEQAPDSPDNSVFPANRSWNCRVKRQVHCSGASNEQEQICRGACSFHDPNINWRTNAMGAT